MNKTNIKNFAVWARQKLISDITYKAGMFGITDSGIAEKLPQSTNDMHFFDIGTKNYAEVSGKDIEKRNALASAIRRKEKDMRNFKEAFQYIVEEVAYTWFNRLIAIRFMEVNNYLPSGVRVLSSENKAKLEPDFVTTPFDTDLKFTPDEQDRIIQIKDENKLDELFRMLFIKQCNKLHDILPELFEKTDDYTELLLTISFTDKDGIVYRLTHDIDEDDFNVEKEGQVEIIGWMYQYYNIEPKAAVFARASGTKIKKEDVPAATQLFTPDWIVRYMVENSLGRLWIEGHPNDNLKGSWNYYIDEAEQEPEVLAKLEEIKATYKGLTPEKIKLIDPCMGSGHILVYAFDVLMQIYESYGYTQRDAARSILQNNIYGLDIDKRAYQLAYFAVMMKSRQYNRRILTENIKCNLCSVTETNNLNYDYLELFGEDKGIAKQLADEFVDAKEYGSILNIKTSVEEIRLLADKLEKIKDTEYENFFDTIRKAGLITEFEPVILQALNLAQKYEVVVTNPPYMAVSNASSKVQDYVKKNYPDSKSDLFAVFIERCGQIIKRNGYQAMITQHSWMFLSDFKKLRPKILQNDVVNMLHLGARAFEEISGEVVQTTSFIIRKKTIRKYASTYKRLVDGKTANEKEELFFDTDNVYISSSESFEKIPDSIFAYWLSESVLRILEKENKLLMYGNAKQGLATTDNKKYLRLWHELEFSKIDFECKSCDEIAERKTKWFPYNKAGTFRKWSSIDEYVVNYENNGLEIKNSVMKKYPYLNNPGFVVKNTETYFGHGITWNDVSTGIFCCRYIPDGYIYDAAGPMFFSDDDFIYMAYFNSNVFQTFANIICQGLHYSTGHIPLIPFIEPKQERENIKRIATQNQIISKEDWDSYETSWDFKKHPLV